MIGLFSNLDWGNWLYGLFAAFIGGGATAVSTAFTVSMVDPHDFAFGGPKSLHVMWLTFLVNGCIVGFAFLKQNPLPQVKVVTTVETTTRQEHPSAVVKTTIEETKMEPVKDASK